MAGEHESRSLYYPPLAQEVTVDVTVLLGPEGEVAQRMVTQGWLTDGTPLPARYFEDLSQML
jgi:hypothetical protein